MPAPSDDHRPAGPFAGSLAGWVLASEGRSLCDRFAFANRLWRLPISVAWHPEKALYQVRDVPNQRNETAVPGRIMIARPERIFRYRRGVADRIARLARKYFIDRIPLDAGDVVVDCGANVGEVGLYVQSRAAVRVIAVEPSPPEANACDENVFDGDRQTERFALWHSAGEQPFYDSNTTGDSSLIAPASQHEGIATIPVTTLDRLAADKGIEHIKLLKIEGEGAEPEILAGATTTISKVSYCTIDCGPERGLAREHVIPQACNFLFDAGFELLDVNLERQIFWFRNRALT